MLHTLFAPRLLTACLLAAGLSSATAASIQLPAELPAFAPAKPGIAPQISVRRLSNGMEVWVLPRQGLPRVDYALALRGAGHGADSAELPGLAKLHAQLLSAGTRHRDARAVLETVQRLGGELRATASRDGITVSANALASKAPQMLQLLAELIREPAYPEAEVEQARTHGLERLNADAANPGKRAERSLSALTFGEHPYGHTAVSETTLQRLSPELLRQAHARRFRPERSLLVISGPLRPEQVFKQVETALGRWQAEGEAAAEPAMAQPGGTAQRLLLDRPGSVQASLRIGRQGHAASAADELPLRLASTLLGGGIRSRITWKLREERGYTYWAWVVPHSYRSGGAIEAGADVRNEVAGAALKDVLAEYRRLGEEPVGADELDTTKRYMAGDYLITMQRQAGMTAALAENWLVGLPADFLASYVQRLAPINAEQLRDIGRRYFDPAGQHIVVVGDRTAIEGQLQGLGDFSVMAK
ncbi:pitrilysin family protein [Paucibacter sp. APW11]|uniref:Pitrilysin family protein n=1 Tax=Roseateles aquae TaxID=3077235 RepID=A0ABU3PEH3_9BURK|nr:pitrilysin family protein [Paucibacter sp. APW11]MDT9000316.1 pitrilysin family protein [Paucibacter sp. APW11]